MDLQKFYKGIGFRDGRRDAKPEDYMQQSAVPVYTVGQVFGRLKLLEKSNRVSDAWLWQCDCANKTIKRIVAKTVIGGKTKGCGCVFAERNGVSYSRRFKIKELA